MLLGLINKTGTIAKVRILVESDTVKHLMTFKIISSEKQYHFLSYVDDILVVCKFIQRNFLIFTFMRLKWGFFQTFVTKVYRSVLLKIISVYIILINKLQVSWRSCFNILTQNYVSEE